MQLEAIFSRPITSYFGEETNSCLTTTSFQVIVESMMEEGIKWDSDVGGKKRIFSTETEGII